MGRFHSAAKRLKSIIVRQAFCYSQGIFFPTYDEPRPPRKTIGLERSHAGGHFRGNLSWLVNILVCIRLRYKGSGRGSYSNCLNAGRTHVLFLMLKTASVMRRYRMNLVHFSIVHDQSHSPFLDGVPAKNRCYAQGCHDPMTSYEPSLSSTCALSTCWLLDEAVVRFIFKKV